MARFTFAIAFTISLAACGGRMRPAQPAPRSTPGMVFTATAYCSGTLTATGARVRSGMVAADTNVLPMGTVIRLTGLDRRYDGTYTVADTGAKIRGRRIDLYVSDCREAVRFGRRPARVVVVGRAKAQ